MTIFATSDIHGNTTLMKKLVKVAENVDLVLYCGDVAKSPAGAPAQMPDVENLMSAFDKLSCPARFIRGNCDNFGTDSPHYLSESETISGVKFIPFESILTTPFGTFREVNEDQMLEHLSELGDCHNAVIVAHNPPFGAGDEIPNGMHVGSHAIAQWLENAGVRAWLCGHVHEGFGKFGNVYNCASDASEDILRGWIINLENGESQEVIL